MAALQNGTIFFSPFFFFFLLLDRSWSLAGVESSALAVAVEEEDCPGWISFTCGGGGSAWSPPLSVGFSSLGSVGALGFNSLLSGAAGGLFPAGVRPKGEPPGIASEGGADASGAG